MQNKQLSRRHFLQATGTLAGSSYARFGIPGVAALAQAACTARDEGAPFVTLGAGEAREFEAIAARILPTTDTPGAREAGAIWFFDKALGSHMASQLDFLRGGLADFQATIPADFEGTERFSDLAEDDQDAYLAKHENGPFFGLLRFMTLCGTFGMSSYGGNRDDVGWKLLGLDPMQHGYQPPFGYYDAGYEQGEADGD